MKFLVALVTFATTLVSASPVLGDVESNAAALGRRAPYTMGLDIDYTSGPGIPWAPLSSNYSFAYIQTTYGMTVTNLDWPVQKPDARSVGFLTGGVHYPDPSVATPAYQARFFTANGGDWVLDKITLPGALYLEVNKQNDTVPYCYNLTPSDWVSWIKEFTSVYDQLNTRYPVILTSTTWWEKCTASFPYFSSYIDLWVIDYSGAPAPVSLPVAWTNWTFWQYSPGAPWNEDYFNGNLADLYTYAV